MRPRWGLSRGSCRLEHNQSHSLFLLLITRRRSSARISVHLNYEVESARRQIGSSRPQITTNYGSSSIRKRDDNYGGVPEQIGADKQRESRTLGEAVGAEITRLRVDRGWSQPKLAHDLGYTERYIGQLERGTKSPTARTLADLAKAFSVEVSTIIRSAERRHRDSGKR